MFQQPQYLKAVKGTRRVGRCIIATHFLLASSSAHPGTPSPLPLQQTLHDTLVCRSELSPAPPPPVYTRRDTEASWAATSPRLHSCVLLYGLLLPSSQIFSLSLSLSPSLSPTFHPLPMPPMLYLLPHLLPTQTVTFHPSPPPPPSSAKKGTPQTLPEYSDPTQLPSTPPSSASLSPPQILLDLLPPPPPEFVLNHTSTHSYSVTPPLILSRPFPPPLFYQARTEGDAFGTPGHRFHPTSFHPPHRHPPPPPSHPPTLPPIQLLGGFLGLLAICPCLSGDQPLPTSSCPVLLSPLPHPTTPPGDAFSNVSDTGRSSFVPT